MVDLQVEVTAANAVDFRVWNGWIGARLRTLVARIEAFVIVRPLDKEQSPSAEQGASPRCFYFMGLRKKPMVEDPATGQTVGTSKAVNLNHPVNDFKLEVTHIHALYALGNSNTSMCKHYCLDKNIHAAVLSTWFPTLFVLSTCCHCVESHQASLPHC
jgi:hypothetical protein